MSPPAIPGSVTRREEDRFTSGRTGSGDSSARHWREHVAGLLLFDRPPGVRCGASAALVAAAAEQASVRADYGEVRRMRRLFAILCVVVAAGSASSASAEVSKTEGVPQFGNVFVIIGENTEISQLTKSN